MSSIVILGAGIHGLSAAYGLAQLRGTGRSITIIDIADDACKGASGRPTAFLSDAQIHNDNLEQLIQYSLALHAQLAKDHQGSIEWQYESVQNYDARAVDAANQSQEKGKIVQTPEGFSWLASCPPWKDAQWSGPTEYCSIDPYALGSFLLDKVRDCGARVLFNTEAKAITSRPGCDVSSVLVRTGQGEKSCEEEIACDRLLIAAGPWTAKVFKSIYPNAKVDVPIYADTGSYSMLLQLFPQHSIEPEWLNKSVVLHSGQMHSLQMMVRTDGLLHAATVPPVTLDLGSAAMGGTVQRAGDDLQSLENEIRSMLSVPSRVLSRRACFSPVTKSGLPIMSQVPSTWLGLENNGIHHRGDQKGGVYVMGGHGYWGVAASLGSGKLMAQLLLGQETDIDISEFCLESHCVHPEQRKHSAGPGGHGSNNVWSDLLWKVCLSCFTRR